MAALRVASSALASLSSPRTLTLLICTLCLLTNLYLYTHPFSTTGTPPITTFDQMIRLRRPNQFRTYGLSNPPPPSILLKQKLMQVPTLLERVSKERGMERKVFGEEEYEGWEELTPPTNRKVEVSDTMSTIAQFVAVDINMTLCELQLSLGSPASPSNPNTTFALLPNPSPQPARAAKVASWDISAGEVHTFRFECELNSVHTFEIAVGEDGTGVSWEQDHRGKTPAVTLNQYWTGSAPVEN